MPRTLSPGETRDFLIDHVERIEGLPTFGQPTEEMYASFARMHENDKARIYTVNRGKRQISVDLNMTVGQFEEVFIGKTVLDIGCGTGVLSNELARLKKTDVTALDINPDMLEQIAEGPNLRTVQGSAFDLKSAVGDEKYDVTISAYSATFWAETEDQKRKSIQSQLGVTASGGTAIWVPIVADIEQREMVKKSLEVAKRRGEEVLPVSATAYMAIEDIEATAAVLDWLDVVALDTLFLEEERGAIDLTFVSSRDNARNLPLRKSAPGPVGRLQRYSAIAKNLSEQPVKE